MILTILTKPVIGRWKISFLCLALSCLHLSLSSFSFPFPFSFPSSLFPFPYFFFSLPSSLFPFSFCGELFQYGVSFLFICDLHLHSFKLINLTHKEDRFLSAFSSQIKSVRSRPVVSVKCCVPNGMFLYIPQLGVRPVSDTIYPVWYDFSKCINSDIRNKNLTCIGMFPIVIIIAYILYSKHFIYPSSRTVLHISTQFSEENNHPIKLTKANLATVGVCSYRR